MKRALLALLAGAAAACGGGEIDVTDLPSIAGYTTWNATTGPLTLSGAIPGHGDSIRAIYRNDYALSYPHGGRYPLGSVLVKEILANDNDQPGKLRYIAVMRKIGDDHPDLPTDDGWLFTYLSKEGSAEEEGKGCWSTCHKAAPRDGSWFDYGDRP